MNPVRISVKARHLFLQFPEPSHTTATLFIRGEISSNNDTPPPPPPPPLLYTPPYYHDYIYIITFYLACVELNYKSLIVHSHAHIYIKNLVSLISPLPAWVCSD